MPDTQTSPTRCFNCGHCHRQLPGIYSPQCFLVASRQSGRKHLRWPDTGGNGVHSIVIPTSIAQRQKLRDRLWDEFEGLMEENRRERERIALRRRAKGQLRADAPLLWLSWTAPDGERGQTRNKASFIAVWERVVEPSTDSCRRLWLSSVLLAGYLSDSSG
jgi:hypothetical protein